MEDSPAPDDRVCTLADGSGLEARISPYGGTLLSLLVPDGRGERADVVLGFDRPAEYRSDAYLAANPYFGALIGRYANRIGGARLALDGETHQLTANEGSNHLHGGACGFDRRRWRVASESPSRLVLRYESPAGEEGYPGRVAAEACFALAGGALTLDLRATADAPTPVNLTFHPYFNLAGEGTGDVLDHLLTIPAEHVVAVGEGQIPTGALYPVEGTPFDFRTAAAVGSRLGEPDAQLRQGGGYDHHFVLRPGGMGPLARAARVEDPRSGRVLTVSTTQPGLQVYSGQSLDGSLAGKRGTAYGPHSGLALEPQHPPDAPNQPGFPSTLLRPGEVYAARTVYAFSARG